MDINFLYGLFFGVWAGVGTYRMFVLLDFDTHLGTSPEEDYGMSNFAYFLFTLLISYSWPIIIPLSYFYTEKDD